jgi:uncharacterized protein
MNDCSFGTMSDLRLRVQEFLRGHNTMTLATTGPGDEPQAAAVFYAADDAFGLYFVSDPTSRHSQNLRREPRAAATIQADGQAWQEIQGLQIEGTAHLVTGLRETARAARTFAGRFDFLKGFLDEGTANGPAELRGPLASSCFYVLRPTWIRLIDNTRGFGHKEELSAGELTDAE